MVRAMQRSLGLLSVVVLLSACASAPTAAPTARGGRCLTPQRRPSPPPPPEAPAATVRQEAVVDEPTGAPAAAPAPRAAPAQPSAEYAVPSREESNAQPVDADDACGPSGSDALEAHEAVIAEALRTLAAGAAECRDICRAAGNICTAAGEICRLAGDGHARCARARGSCTDAGRRRDGSCPVCPATR